MSELVGVPEGGELWRINNRWWVVYHVPGSNPPVPMGWRIGASAESVLPPGAKPKAEKSFSTFRQATRAGLLHMGSDAQLQDFGGNDPFETFVNDYERQAQALPMLQDPEVMALFAGALLEGRQPTPEELSQTEWWQSRSAAEREWATLQVQDPETARQRQQTSRLKVAETLREMGASAPRELVNAIGDRVVSGQWTEEYANRQMQILGQGRRGRLDEDLQPFQGRVKQSRQHEHMVNEMAREWLGPTHMLDKEQVNEWARRFRVGGAGTEDKFMDYLKRQRRSLIPEFEDPDLTYEDIVGPWRGFIEKTWGQVPDEQNDDTLLTVARMGDANEARKYLQHEGLRRGNQQVVNDFSSRFSRAIEGPIRRSVV